MKKPQEQIFRFLDTNGDGTGTVNAIGNYATVADEFYIEAPAAVRYSIERMLVYVEDVGTFDSDLYGNGVALTNGITVSVKDSSNNTLLDLTAGQPITQNGHWARNCYDVDHQNYGVGNEYIAVRWTFSKSGNPVFIDHGNRLAVTVNDNLSGLVAHTFQVHGEIV